jgi:hypothetical protein
LKRAYGDRLAIVYIANVGMRGGESASTLESRLLEECARLNVPCASTRDSMLALRRRHLIVRGFSTTTLGDGHLNSVGHEAVGHAIWGLVR